MPSLLAVQMSSDIADEVNAVEPEVSAFARP